MIKPFDNVGVECVEAEAIADRQRHVLGEAGQPLLGVAFSGGGIRSATFNLGIVQGMAKSGLLPRIDYLSTVSGGGYVGTWLHGVIRRFGGGDPRAASVKALLTRPESGPHRDPVENPVAFLRKYSSYLAPDMSLFSADFWVIVGIWLRNTLLNQLIILPFLAAISLVVFFIGSLAGWHANTDSPLLVELAIAGAALFGMVWCAGHGVGAVALDRFRMEGDNEGRGNSEGRGNREARGNVHAKWDSVATTTACALLMLLAAVALALASESLDTFHLMSGSPLVGLTLGLVLSFMFGILQWKGKFSECYNKRHGKLPRFGPWGYPLLAGIPTGFLLYGVMWMLLGLDRDVPGVWNTVAWGPPLLALAMLTGACLHIGLMGVDFDDNAREWLARLGANATLAGFAWTALFIISVFGPYWVTKLAVFSWAPLAGLGGWVLTSLGGALAGNSTRTPAKMEEKETSHGIIGLVVTVAPTVFIVGYLLLISWGTHFTIAHLCGLWMTPGAAAVSMKNASAWTIAIAATERRLIWEHGNFVLEMQVVAGLLLAAGVLIGYLPRRIDVKRIFHASLL